MPTMTIDDTRADFIRHIEELEARAAEGLSRRHAYRTC